MEGQIIIELMRLFISSAFTLAELAKLSDEDRERILTEEFAKVKARHPADLPDIK
jgi:hypothetical protein